MKDVTTKRLGAIEKYLEAIGVRLEQLGQMVETSRASQQPEPITATERPATASHVERALVRVTELANLLRDREAIGRWDAGDAQIARVMLEDLTVVAADLRKVTNGAGKQHATALRDLREIRVAALHLFEPSAAIDVR